MEFGKVSRYDLLYYNKVNGCADNHRTHAYYQFDIIPSNGLLGVQEI